MHPERTGAEDHRAAPIEGPIALQEAERGLGTHHARLLPTGKAYSEIARSRRENQAIETHQPGPLLVGKPEHRLRHASEAWPFDESAPGIDAELDVDAELEGFGKARI